jgi:nuclear transport factor 2 (NTF2) superfamily protein
MKKLLLCLACVIFYQVGFSQKVYFIYIQSENNEAFYLKMNEKLYSSTASGYLILSKLHDSTYTFRIGFPANKWPEQPFTVSLNKKDRGYLLKSFAEKGWGLFDLQALTVQMSAAAGMNRDPVAEKDVSLFTDILSKAADDPSLREKTVIPVVVEKKPEPVIVKTEKTADTDKKPVEKETQTETVKKPVVEQKEQVVVKAEPDKEKQATVKEEKSSEKEKEAVVVKKEPASEVSEFKHSTITRRSESSTTEGFGMVFLDDNGGGNVDTIRILIPNPRPVVAAVKEVPKEEKKFLDIPTEPVKAAETKDTKTETIKEEIKADQPGDNQKEIKTAAKEEKSEVKKEPVKEEKKEDIKEPVKEEKQPVAVTDTIKTAEQKPLVAEKEADKADKTAPAKKSCMAIAENSDFFRLRKTMAGVESNEEMISEAGKYFKKKCFTTLQIKNLSALFLDEEGKYKFFDALLH